jgi:putative FmdB family regulatory protein
MPIYEYVCNNCERKFEVLVNAGEEVTCPVCKSAELSKQFSTFAPTTRQSAPASMPVCSPGGCGNCSFNDN